MVEIYFNVQSDNGSLTRGSVLYTSHEYLLILGGEPDHALQQWSSRYLESLNGLKDLRVPLRLQNMMRDAGFVDIESRMIQLHTCGWSSGKFDVPRIRPGQG
jgi:hypothetical protein